MDLLCFQCECQFVNKVSLTWRHHLLWHVSMRSVGTTYFFENYFKAMFSFHWISIINYCYILHIFSQYHFFHATWTLSIIMINLIQYVHCSMLAADTRALEGFYMRCQWPILNIRGSISSKMTRSLHVPIFCPPWISLSKCWHSMFSHIASQSANQPCISDLPC